MSKELYLKGKRPIKTEHGWKIWAATKATEDLFEAFSEVMVKIGDVEIDRNFFVKVEVSHCDNLLLQFHKCRKKFSIVAWLSHRYGANRGEGLCCS